MAVIVSLYHEELLSVPLDSGLELSLALTNKNAAELMCQFQVSSRKALCTSAGSHTALTSCHVSKFGPVWRMRAHGVQMSLSTRPTLTCQLQLCQQLTKNTGAGPAENGPARPGSPEPPNRAHTRELTK